MQTENGFARSVGPAINVVLPRQKPRDHVVQICDAGLDAFLTGR